MLSGYNKTNYYKINRVKQQYPTFLFNPPTKMNRRIMYGEKFAVHKKHNITYQWQKTEWKDQSRCKYKSTERSYKPILLYKSCISWSYNQYKHTWTLVTAVLYSSHVTHVKVYTTTPESVCTHWDCMTKKTMLVKIIQRWPHQCEFSCVQWEYSCEQIPHYTHHMSIKWSLNVSACVW